jgi:thioredoxin-like negative regulator of GroEL
MDFDLFLAHSSLVGLGFQARTFATSKNVIEGTDANFDAVVLKSAVPVVVDFYAE